MGRMLGGDIKKSAGREAPGICLMRTPQCHAIDDNGTGVPRMKDSLVVCSAYQL